MRLRVYHWAGGFAFVWFVLVVLFGWLTGAWYLTLSALAGACIGIGVGQWLVWRAKRR